MRIPVSEPSAIRTFPPRLRQMLVCAAFVFVGAICGAAQSARELPDGPTVSRSDRKINIVVYLIDTLRADRVGIYGYSRRQTTPHIDALARSGVLFEQASAAAPWTLPSVCSLVTSTYLCEHQVLDNRVKLGEEYETLAMRLKRQGYRTLGMYANALVGPAFGLDRGFDVYKPLRGMNAGMIGRMLKNGSREPFFLYIHSIEPHTPYIHAPHGLDGFRDVSDEVRKRIQKCYIDYRNSTRVDFTAKRPIGSTDNSDDQRRLLAALNDVAADYSELYDASIVAADRQVGALIASLKAIGVWDDTLLIVLSDHGEEMNEHGGWLHDQSVYEELMHVPLVIRFPRDEFAGRRVRKVVSLVDILPTIADYSGVAAGETRGRSLMPAIRGDDEPDGEELRITGMRWNIKKYYRPWKESRGDINVVMRQGAWKGIWNVEPRTLELYNLESDPGERRDVHAEHAELADRMRHVAEAWLDECKAEGFAESRPTAEPDQEAIENLRRLGYVD